MLNLLTYYLVALYNKAHGDNQKRDPYGSDLEKYIIAHEPKTPADVEYWTREYDRKLAKRGWSTYD